MSCIQCSVSGPVSCSCVSVSRVEPWTVSVSRVARYEVTNRLLAADLLLASPRPSDAGRLLYRLQNRNASEESAYVLQRLRAAAARSAELRPALSAHLSDQRLANYDSLAQGALSAVLERSLWRNGAVEAGFSSELESAQSRALRRSEFAARLQADGRRLDVLQVRRRRAVDRVRRGAWFEGGVGGGEYECSKDLSLIVALKLHEIIVNR